MNWRKAIKNGQGINGKAKIYSSGKYFEIALKRSKPPSPKYAIVVNIKEIFDLDRIKKIL